MWWFFFCERPPSGIAGRRWEMNAPKGSEGTRDALLPASPVPERQATESVDRKSGGPAISWTGLFALFFMRVQDGLRRIFGKPRSFHVGLPLTREEFDRNNAALDLWLSQPSHIPSGSSPEADKWVDEMVWLGTSPDRYCPSLEEVDQIAREFDAIHGKRPESEYPIPRSAWARIAAVWKRCRKGVQG